MWVDARVVSILPLLDRVHDARSSNGECGAVVTHSSPLDRGWHQCVVGRVRALIGWRIRKQTRHAGVHEVCDAASCERRHAARPVEPPAGRTAVIGGKRFPAQMGRPAPATAQQRVQVSHREDVPDTGNRRRVGGVDSSCLVHSRCGRARTDDLSASIRGLAPTARLFGAAESRRNRFGARRLDEDGRDCARSPRP